MKHTTLDNQEISVKDKRILRFTLIEAEAEEYFVQYAKEA